MEWAIAILVIAVLGGAAVVAAGGVGEMSREPVRDGYRQDLPDRPLSAADLQELRFGITVRGYAMDQVDDVLDRLSNEIAERDALIAQLADDPDDDSADDSAHVSADDAPSESHQGSSRDAQQGPRPDLHPDSDPESQLIDNEPVTAPTPAGGKVSR